VGGPGTAHLDIGYGLRGVRSMTAHSPATNVQKHAGRGGLRLCSTTRVEHGVRQEEGDMNYHSVSTVSERTTPVE